MALEEENLYNENSRQFNPLGVSDAQKKQLEEEQNAAKAQKPAIETIIKHLKIRIKARESIKTIQVDIAEDPLLHQKTCAVNEMVAQALTEEKEMLEALIADL